MHLHLKIKRNASSPGLAYLAGPFLFCNFESILYLYTMSQEEQLVSFGNYLLSPEREERLRNNPSSDKLPPLEDRLNQVHHADIENWKESLQDS